VREFAAAAEPVVASLLGVASTWWNGTVRALDGEAAVQAQLTADGTMRIEPAAAARIVEILTGEVIVSRDLASVVLHELIHAAGQGAAPAGPGMSLQHDVEEGFTQLATVHLGPAFYTAMGLAGLPADFYAPVGLGGRPRRQVIDYDRKQALLDDLAVRFRMTRLDIYEAGRQLVSADDVGGAIGCLGQLPAGPPAVADDSRQLRIRLCDVYPLVRMTLGDCAAFMDDPSLVACGMVAPYGTLAMLAQRWCRQLATAQGYAGPALWTRVRELTAAVCRARGPAKSAAMARMVLDVTGGAGAQSDDAQMTDAQVAVEAAIMAGWRTGRSFARALQVAS
jgi:hypothetical protein